MYKRFVQILMVVIFFSPGMLYAGFADDWIDQQTSTAAGSFEGQKRGYMTGGSYSARWQMGNDQLISFESPRVKFGCSGIDVFMGSFSYLQPEYLVKKMQKILQAAPAAALDLAINTMCEPCAKTMKSLESITDLLNNLNINDCKAAKALGGKMLDTMGIEKPKVRADADKEWALNKGLSDLSGKINDMWSASDGEHLSTHADRVAKCPAKLKEILTPDSESIIEAVMKDYPEDYRSLARGMVGDVKVKDMPSGAGTALAIVPIEPCKENDSKSIEDIVKGIVYSRLAGLNDGCFKNPSGKANLEKWVSASLSSITAKMEYKSGKLSEDEEKLAKLSPAPIITALKMASATKTSATINEMSAYIISRGFAYQMLSDLYHEISASIAVVNELVGKKAEPTEDCKLGEYHLVAVQIEKLLPKIAGYAKSARAAYAASMAQVSAIQQVSINFGKFNKIAYEKLSHMFGSAVAGRATGK